MRVNEIDHSVTIAIPGVTLDPGASGKGLCADGTVCCSNETLLKTKAGHILSLTGAIKISMAPTN